jgi:hypothetical protein
MLKLAGKIGLVPFRQKSIERAERWIIERQDTPGDWAGIIPAMLNSLLALHVLGYSADHPYVKRGIEAIDRFGIEEPGADGLAKMQQAMRRLRSRPPAELGGMKVATIRDYLTQRSFSPGGHAVSPIAGVPASDLLIFDLEPAGNRAAVRPSGTEPKLKFYLFAYDPPASSTDLPATNRRLTERLDRLEADLLVAANSVKRAYAC